MNNNAFWQKKRVLIDGGCGFLGSYLVPQILEAGAEVTVVDNLVNGYLDNLDAVIDQIEFIEADLGDLALCNKVTQGQDIVINLAAQTSGVKYSSLHNGEMLTYNLPCVLMPLEAARKNGVMRHMIVSSSCIYSDNAPIPTPELNVFTGMPEKVNEGYGWAKRIQELAGTYYAQDYGMKVTIVRPFNLYGGNYRWKSEERANVIPALVKRIMDGEDPVVIWGSGNQRRNFLHASDAARIMMLIIEKDIIATPVNIGYEDSISIAELVNIICEIAGVSPKIVFDKSKPEGCLCKCADATRLREVTNGYLPKVNLREGIIEMIEWYRRWFRK